MKQRAAKLSNSSQKNHVISVSEYFATEHKASYFGSTNATTTNRNGAEIQIKPEVSHSVLQEVGWRHQGEAVLQICSSTSLLTPIKEGQQTQSLLTFTVKEH